MSDSDSFFHEIIRLQNDADIFFETVYDTSSFIPSHWHNAIEIIYIITGELDAEIGSIHHILKNGDIMLINSKVIHSTKCVKGNHTILVQLPFSFLKRYIPELSSRQFILNYKTDNPVERTKITQLKVLLEKMNYIKEEQPDGGTLIFQSMLFELLFALYHNFSIPLTTLPDRKINKNLARLELILQYTNKHYAEGISLSDVSSLLYLQPAYFCRFFKKNMGITYLEYLNEVRLSHIYHDLLTTDYSVHELLEKHGFTNYKLFRRIFREKFGSTPLQVRKKVLAR